MGSALVALLLVVLAGWTEPQDALADLKSKDPLTRLAAVETLSHGAEEGATKALVKALGDKDWEVVERAVLALGEVGDPGAMKAVAKVAVDGEVRRMRRAASRALLRLAERHGEKEEAGELLAASLKKHPVAASQALEELGSALDGEVSLKALRKLVEGRDAAPRRAAARALVRLAGEERAEVLGTLLEHRDAAVRAFAVEAAATAADPAVEPILLGRLHQGLVSDVLERRIHRALRATLLAPERGPFPPGPTAAPAAGRARHARMLGALARPVEGVSPLSPDDALSRLDAFLVSQEPRVRRAAAGALRPIGSKAALARAGALASEDGDDDVRRITLASLLAHRGPAGDEAVLALLLERLENDGSREVREAAAVALGVRRLEGASAGLVAALQDPDWRVTLAAAVSLGKTRAEEGTAPLVELYTTSDDWRRRGAAIAGLAQLRSREGVPTAIAALADAESLVRRTAFEYLVSLSNRRLEATPEVWTRWWGENGQRVRMEVPDAVLARRRELQYVKSAAEIYEGLDVVVLESQGDHIEHVLERLGLDHRRTRSGNVLDAELHPEAVFVSNCTGNVSADEAERLEWFVRAGGYLFGSCWALQETIERIEPNRVAKLEVGEVLGDVPAHACDPDSPYLEGAYGQDVRPIYHLEGAHLIEVLDPESVEVLVDSPECEATFGGGNLAAWFRAGHGVVLDSVNHFDLQGFETARGLKKPEDRQAYAIDHLGLSYEELRETRDEKFWRKASGASDKVSDLSVFRLITNFVREKRVGDDA